MRDVIIETEAMQTFNQAADSMMNPDTGTSGFLLAHGQAGRGKTVAAHRYHVERGGAYIRVWEGMNHTTFMQRILFEVRGKNGDMPRHTGSRCKEMIIDFLLQKRMFIKIDEADRLSMKLLESLRDILDETGSPIGLIAEEGIFGLLTERRRIWSRVVHEVEFGPINAAEISLYAMKAAGLDIPPQLALSVAEKAEGDFRIVRNMMVVLEQAAKAAGDFKVNKEVLDTALASRSWRRK